MFDKLKQASIQARKDKSDDASLLVTLLSEATMRAKDDGNREVTETDVVKVAQKFMKGAEDTAKLLRGDSSRVDALNMALREIEVLNEYLPSVMNEDDTRAAVAAAIESTGASSMKDMGMVMGALKKNHGVTIDMKLASEILKGSF